MKDSNKESTKIDLEILAIISFLLFPVFVTINQSLEKGILDAKRWTKYRTSRLKNPLFLFFAGLMLPLSFLGVLKFLILHKFSLAVASYFLYVFMQVPFAFLFGLNRFNKVLSDTQTGKISPFLFGKLKRVKFQHNSDYAKLTYLDVLNRRDLPANLIGKRIEPINAPAEWFKDADVQDSELQEVVSDSLAIFPLNSESPQHHLVIGQTGSGKTVLIRRMIKAGLRSGWRVVLIDMKGDPYDADSFLNIEVDQSKVREFPSTCFNFWAGTAEEISERVISFFPSDSDPFYLTRNSYAVQAVINRSGLPLPTSVEELLERIRRGAFVCLDIADKHYFATKDRGIPVGELISNDIASYLDPIRSAERNTPMRFHWGENWNLALFRLDGYKPTSLRVASAILNDFASWIFSAERTMNKKPILFIVDEASAFSALQKMPILTSLIQRARSAKVSLVYASQNLSAFGEEKNNILHSGAMRWLGLSTDVEEMINATGTESVVEAGFQFDLGSYTGTITHRSQKEYKIDPDLVKELPVFHWFVSWKGKFSTLYIPPN